jgi:predicted ATP-grasp superfamily ATP-dependent carboligase
VRALIVEQGWSRGALAAARGLAAAGWTVGVASAQTRGLALASRDCHRRHRVRPLHPAGDFVRSVAEVVKDGGYDLVFAAGEAEVLALSAARDAVPAVLPYAPHDVVLRALDKGELNRVAAGLGIALPDVVDPEAVPDEVTPVVVKARMHARPDLPGSPPRIDTNVVLGRTAVQRRVAEIRAAGGEPQVQVFHEGALLAYTSVRGPGGVAARCLQRADRIWPPGAGASCRAHTTDLEPELVDRCDELLAALDWFGLAELQFLRGADGVPRLIDLNGRFYGSMSLAMAAGVNLPAIWADAAMGLAPARPVHARAGVRYQWGAADLRRAWRERQGGLLGDVTATLAYAVRARHSVASARDPRPAVVRAARAVTDALSGGQESGG